MSYNHENVVWQSADGTWNRGFFAEDYLTCGGDEDECGDETHEWCREFDQSRFEWVSVGHATADDAYRSWTGSNPGSSTQVTYDPSNPHAVEWVEDYEDMAARLCEQASTRAQEARQKGTRGWSVWGGRRENYGFHGPVRERDAASFQADHIDLLRTHWSSRLEGNAVGDSDWDKQRTAERRAAGAKSQAARAALPPDSRVAQRCAAQSDEFYTWLAARVGEAETRARELRYRANRNYGYGTDHSRPNRITEAVAGAREIIAKHEAKKSTPPAAEPEKTQPTKDAPAAKTPAKKPAPKKAAPVRAKTTAKSTAGSFAPVVSTEADPAALGLAASPSGDAWDAVGGFDL